MDKKPYSNLYNVIAKTTCIKCTHHGLGLAMWLMRTNHHKPTIHGNGMENCRDRDLDVNPTEQLVYKILQTTTKISHE
jgi:hypothetical protein